MTLHLLVWPPSYCKLDRFNDTEKKKVITRCIPEIDAAAFAKLRAMNTKVVAKIFWRCAFLCHIRTLPQFFVFASVEVHLACICYSLAYLH
jgi:hypothetical protein